MKKPRYHQFTGDEIKRIRNKFDLSQIQFADLVGVAPTSVYRWESWGKRTAPADPMRTRLLSIAEEADAKVCKSVANAVRIHGGLMGLYRLLGSVYAP